MSLAGFLRKSTGRIYYAFEGEEYRLPKVFDPNLFDGAIVPWYFVYEKLPPSPVVVLATNTFMSEPQLDSIESVYELDRQLNIEASEEREMRGYQESRRNA